MKFTTADFRPNCGCRSAGECSHGSFAEVAALDAMVDAFAAEMKKKLKAKLVHGYGGWDSEDPEVRRNIEIGLSVHVARHLRGEGAQSVDIANFAAMLWNRAQSSTNHDAQDAGVGR